LAEKGRVAFKYSTAFLSKKKEVFIKEEATPSKHNGK